MPFPNGKTHVPVRHLRGASQTRCDVTLTARFGTTPSRASSWHPLQIPSDHVSGRAKKRSKTPLACLFPRSIVAVP
jgi:hypothetical protein